MKCVRVAVVGQRVQEVAIEDGQTIAVALDIAEVDYSQSQLRVNGSAVTSGLVPTEDNIRVDVVPNVKNG